MVLLCSWGLAAISLRWIAFPTASVFQSVFHAPLHAVCGGGKVLRFEEVKQPHQCWGAQGWVALPPSLGALSHQGCSCTAPKKQHPYEPQQEVGTMTGCLAHGRHMFPRPREAPPPLRVPARPVVPWPSSSCSRPAPSWLLASCHSTRERGSAFPSPHRHLPTLVIKGTLCTTMCFSPVGSLVRAAARFGDHRSAQSTSTALG